MTTDGTTGAGVVLASDGDGTTLGYGTVDGDGTTGAGVATVGAGTAGIDGTTGVGVATTVAGTTGVGEVTTVAGTIGVGTVATMVTKDMQSTGEDVDIITTTILLQVTIIELHLEVGRI